MYKVIRFFTDLQDGAHPYRVGDTFPREGKIATDQRLMELSSPNNRQRTPLIEKVPEPVKEEPKKAEPVEKNAEPAEEKPKRRKRTKVD